MRALSKRRGAHDPFKGFIAFNAFIIRVGVCLPLHLFCVRELDYFSIALMQLALNGWRVLTCIYILYRELEFLKLTMEEINYMYNLKRVSGPLEKLFRYFYLSILPLSRLNLFNLYVSNVGAWKNGWFLANQVPIQNKVFQ